MAYAVTKNFWLINPCLYVFITRNAEYMKYFPFTVVSSLTPFFVMNNEVRSPSYFNTMLRCCPLQFLVADIKAKMPTVQSQFKWQATVFSLILKHYLPPFKLLLIWPCTSVIVCSCASFKSPATQEKTSVLTDPESGNERGLFNLIKTIQWVKLELEGRSQNLIIHCSYSLSSPLNSGDLFVLVFSIQSTVFLAVLFSCSSRNLSQIENNFRKKNTEVKPENMKGVFFIQEHKFCGASYFIFHLLLENV